MICHGNRAINYRLGGSAHVEELASHFNHCRCYSGGPWSNWKQSGKMSAILYLLLVKWLNFRVPIALNYFNHLHWHRPTFSSRDCTFLFITGAYISEVASRNITQNIPSSTRACQHLHQLNMIHVLSIGPARWPSHASTFLTPSCKRGNQLNILVMALNLIIK